MTTYDYLLIGHGLAGATLAHTLRRRGRTVLVYDPGHPNSASKVAAGLINPVAGKRFALAWKIDELLPAATAFYQAMEQHYGETFFIQAPIQKLFSSVAEQNTVVARSADAPWRHYVTEVTGALPPLAGVRQEFGGIQIQHGGYVRLRELLAMLAQEALAQGWLRQEVFEWSQLVFDADGATYAPGQVRARQVVCCEGVGAVQNPYFNWLPLTPNQGEVLDVACPGLPDGQVLNKGAYVVPLGEGHFRVGATYRWPPFAEGITPEATAELSQRLADMTTLPFTITAQRAGVRPAVRDRKPLLGRHPGLPILSIFNGFGSKGVLLAPGLADQLANYLENSASDLWPEVNISRYHALYKAAPVAAAFSS
ncbi:NAD(P)/FAD-dependent oxidoreductase [Hymenobacter profundi]|uniref:FAD-binding oxidoreductase n=1 Tax=Hymenobacter profundi TaxID=1982110 RepID=A0ABS6X3F8_9BACT|nr:FAD-dependent oxidoreductase [Hymenobacter profundi]MBW3130374.1 FAD-binding oxidoreductase [Hymenobacter profundi]